MGQMTNRIRKSVSAAAAVAAVTVSCGCQSLGTTVDKLVPPWGPPEQWEPEYEEASADGDAPANYAAIFEEDAP